jgi:cytochrome c oxidase subunit 2
VFRTDARVFNPSYTDAITIEASLLPAGNIDNSAVPPIEITVAPREMKVYDDVVSSLFSATGLAGIRFSSGSDLGATARIFADNAPGTLGQFVVGTPVGSALTKGVLIQLKSSDAFRTNVGFLNPSASSDANVTFRLHDKSNNEVASTTQIVRPFGVVSPTAVTLLFPGVTADLSDCWVSFESDQPVLVYGSVVDNLTTDPTFVPAIPDTGVKPPQQVVKEFLVEAFQFDYTVVPTGGSPTGDQIVVKKGDHVRLILTAADNGEGSGHGFSMFPFVSSRNLSVGVETVVEFVASESGTFTFFCTIICGSGHNSMRGTMTVQP